MARLRESGLRFEIGEKQLLSNALDGLKFVISGTFSEHSRDQLKELIESHGGRNQSGVSANTDYLLAGERIGPAKLNKARKLGVRIIGEEDFVRMLSGDMPDAAWCCSKYCAEDCRYVLRYDCRARKLRGYFLSSASPVYLGADPFRTASGSEKQAGTRDNSGNSAGSFKPAGRMSVLHAVQLLYADL